MLKLSTEGLCKQCNVKINTEVSNTTGTALFLKSVISMKYFRSLTSCSDVIPDLDQNEVRP